MTPRTFWDRHGHLWEYQHRYRVMREVWDFSTDSAIQGAWWPAEDVHGAFGPLVASC